MYLSLLEPVFLGFTCSRAGIIHVNSRFRRDVRTLDEEEELWFDQEDENGEETVTLEQTDLLNDDSAFKNRKTFVNAKPPPSIVNNKRVSISAVLPCFLYQGLLFQLLQTGISLKKNQYQDLMSLKLS